MPKKMMGITTYTLAETAESLGVTPRTVQNYLSAGLIAGSKIGGRWAFSEKQIQEYITQRSVIDNRPGSINRMFKTEKKPRKR